MLDRNIDFGSVEAVTKIDGSNRHQSTSILSWYQTDYEGHRSALRFSPQAGLNSVQEYAPWKLGITEALLDAHAISPGAGRGHLFRCRYRSNRVRTGTCMLTVEGQSVCIATRISSWLIHLHAVFQGQDGDMLLVADIEEGGSAHREGSLQIGDRLLAVDGINVSRGSDEELRNLVVGDAGSRVCFLVRRTMWVVALRITDVESHVVGLLLGVLLLRLLYLCSV